MGIGSSVQGVDSCVQKPEEHLNILLDRSITNTKWLVSALPRLFKQALFEEGRKRAVELKIRMYCYR
jgi:hypothetical protein